MDTESFSGVNRPGPGVDHQPPSSAEVNEEKGYTSTSPLGFSGLFKVNFTFTFTFTQFVSCFFRNKLIVLRMKPIVRENDLVDYGAAL
jgi:hypothetical protein